MIQVTLQELITVMNAIFELEKKAMFEKLEYEDNLTQIRKMVMDLIRF